jgi:hypothetical protein
MNKKLFFIVTALLLVLYPTTQSVAQISIKAGINIASIAESAIDDNYEEMENKSVVGFQGGLAFDLMPNSFFSIQPELLYIQKGGKVAYELDRDNRIESRYYYNYVEVPVLAKLKFMGEKNSVGFYLLGGPYAGLALNGKVKNTVTFLGQTSTSEDKFNFDNDDAEEHEERLDWGVSFGGGLQFNSIYLDLRYNLGLNNLMDNDADNDNDNESYRRHRGIGVTLGYQF